MMSTTETQGSGLKPPHTATGAGFEDDEIRELGDRIARLDADKADELCQYLSRKYGLSWTGSSAR